MTLPDLGGRFSAKGLVEFVCDKLPNDAIIVECGVFVGTSSMNIVKYLKERGKTFTLFGIDNFQFANVNKAEIPQHLGPDYPKNLSYPELYKWHIEQRGYDGIVEVIIDDCTHAVENFDDGEIDWLFLDDGHLYPYVKNEIEAWLRKMKPHGIISGDDYNSGPVKQSVTEALPNHKSLIGECYHSWYQEL